MTGWNGLCVCVCVTGWVVVPAGVPPSCWKPSGGISCVPTSTTLNFALLPPQLRGCRLMFQVQSVSQSSGDVLSQSWCWWTKAGDDCCTAPLKITDKEEEETQEDTAAAALVALWSELDNNRLPSLFVFSFWMALPFLNAFYGLFSRRICEINPTKRETFSRCTVLILSHIFWGVSLIWSFSSVQSLIKVSQKAGGCFCPHRCSSPFSEYTF